MVRYQNATVDVLAETPTIDDSGDTILEYSKVDTIVGDVQPHSLTEDEIKLYGISARKGNVKLFLYNGLHDSIKAGNRARVTSDFTGTTELYSIMPVNAWSRHGECLLVPVENEAPEEDDIPSGDDTGDDENTSEEENEG